MKILHSADWHYVYTNHGGVDPETGLHSRLIDLDRSVEFMCYVADRERVDLAVIAGDLFRNARPSARELIHAARAIERLAGICPVVVITGNHDCRNDGEPGPVDVLNGWLSAYGNVSIYTRPGGETVPTRSGSVRVLALPHFGRSTFLAQHDNRELTPAEFNAVLAAKAMDVLRGLVAEDHSPALARIVVAHCAVSGAVSSTERELSPQDEPELRLADLVALPVDLVLLGHIHKAQQLYGADDGPWVGYSGSLERINFGEENDKKGFWIHELTAGGWRHEFHGGPARRFVTLGLAIAQVGDGDIQGAIVRVRDAVDAATAQMVDRAAIRDLIEAAGASLSGVELEIERADRARDKAVTEAMGPVDALARYIAGKDELQPRAERLLATAADLVAEVTAG